MITGELRNKIDRICENFWTGGITNSLSVIEQITYILFIRSIDEIDTKRIKEAEIYKIEYRSIFTKTGIGGTDNVWFYEKLKNILLKNLR